MSYNLGKFGEDIAREDQIIQNIIDNITEKENTLIRDYKLLNNFNKSAPISLKSELEKDLEKKRLYLEYKLSSKEKQCESLLKLLEYINILDVKDKELESVKIINKVNEIEENLKPLNNILSIKYM
tara:strand:+ start:558 stop:935 length:378 start_codon:yes stop_codon:yes gene_type:complete